MLLKIGELARRTGLTVRALHHYDAIGLLRPSARSDAGYRLYNRADIERLYRIQALRRLDLPLADIAALLERDGADLQSVIEQQIAQLERQAARAIELRDRLKLLQVRLAGDGQPDLPDWLATLELMTMYDKYFTRADLATMRALTERLGIKISSEAKTLTARIRALMDQGAPADSEAAQALAKPWMALVNARMGSDVRLIMKLDAMHRNEPMVQALSGVDGAMIDYMAHAFLEYRLSLYRKYLNEQEVAPLRGKFFAYRDRWLALTAATREQMDKGADPRSHEVRELCLGWQALERDLWGSDPALLEKVHRAHAGEPDLLIGPCVDQAMIAFMEAGMACLAGQQQDMTGHLHEQTTT